jgi:preprotein translocase subunit SecG
MTNPLFYATLIAFFFLCAIFILLILIQKGRGGGISSAFGGAGGNTAFGSKTGDVLTWATSVVFAVFLLMCVALNYLAADVNAEATRAQTGIVAPPIETGNTAVPTTETTPVPQATPTPTPITTPTPAMPDVETPTVPSTQPGTN